MTAIGAVLPCVGVFIYSLFGFEATSVNVIKAITKNITCKVCAEYGLVLEELEGLKQECEEQHNCMERLQDDFATITEELKREARKIDGFSIGISLVEDI